MSGQVPALLSLLPLLWQEPAPPADLVVLGRVFTAAEEPARAEGLAIRGNRIIAVGSRAEMARLIGDATEVIDAGERSVLPGFNDAHAHFDVAYGIDLGCDLSSATSLAEIQEALRAHAREHPEPALISGWGFDLADFPDGTRPDARMLDAVDDARPIALSSEGPHSLWVNAIALEAMRVPDEDPPGMRVFRDAEGEPTGFFVGRGVLALSPRGDLPDLAEIERGLERGFAAALEVGVTTVHDPVSSFLLPSLVRRCDAGELTLRFHVWGRLSGPGAGLEATKELARLHARDGWITFGTLKGGLDGMPGLRTAALLDDYADEPGNRGLMTDDPVAVARLVEAANAGGYRVALHATGDAAVRAALDAFAASHAKHPAVRNRVEHAFYVAPEDRARFAATGTIASLQPGFLVRDFERRNFHEARLGPARLSEAFPVRSLLDAGATLAFGTDCSLTPLDPFYALHAAVTRTTAQGEPSGGWLPAERIELEDAVRAYTLGSAMAEGAADAKGTLTPGKLADVIVLSEDVFAMLPERLDDARVDVTIVDGRVRWRRER